MSSSHNSGQEFSISEDLVQSRVQKTAGDTLLDFDGLLEPPLRLHEDVSNGCGGQLWPAGMVLAKHCLQVLKSDLADKFILELGAGAGIVGLAVARWLQDRGPAFYGRARIEMTDQLPMLDLMRRNITLNNLTSSLIEGSVLDWGVNTYLLKTHPDIILAADCVYYEPAFPLLLQELKRLIGPNSICFFCMKKRRKADMRFIKELKRVFDVREPHDPGRSTWGREGLHLYALNFTTSKVQSIDRINQIHSYQACTKNNLILLAFAFAT